MTKVAISIAAENTFTDPLNCPRDSVLITLNPTGGTAIGTVTIQVRDYTNPTSPGVWEDWAKQLVASGVCQSFIIDIPVSNQQIRVGFLTGEYTSGTLTGRIQHS
ncbi:MAG: hypothetical protein WC343_12635 [Bacilli bacterium]|jgi:hypothetical protein